MTQSKTVSRRDRLAAATGLASKDAQNWLMGQLMNALYFPDGSTNADKAEALDAALALLEEITPQDGIEAMLAIQMVAIQAATMDCLRRAKSQDQTPETRDSNLRHATRLSALCARQGTVLRTWRRHRLAALMDREMLTTLVIPLAWAQRLAEAVDAAGKS